MSKCCTPNIRWWILNIYISICGPFWGFLLIPGLAASSRLGRADVVDSNRQGFDMVSPLKTPYLSWLVNLLGFFPIYSYLLGMIITSTDINYQTWGFAMFYLWHMGLNMGLTVSGGFPRHGGSFLIFQNETMEWTEYFFFCKCVLYPPVN